MRITSIHLENIKSYVDDTVKLTPGTNSIWGPNGSGKTTLLEAIGFALFDFLPYSHKAFVREGEPFGVVRIRLIATDDREYEVVRQLGRSKAHLVTDVATNQKLVDGTTSVIDWLRTNVVGSFETDDPKFLFENAIGVPQSMMTAAFRGTPAQRKATFDKILGVEEYESTWQKLLASENLVKGQVAEASNRISHHEGETARLPELEVEVAKIKADIDGSEKKLAGTNAAFERVDAGVHEHELKAQACNIAKEAIERNQANLNTAERERDSAVEHEEKARRARDLVTAAESKYESYCNAEMELVRLEPLRVERDSAREHLTHLRARLSAEESNRETINADREAASAASDTIRTLQTEMDGLAQIVEQRVQAVKAVEKQAELTPTVVALTSKIAQLQERHEDLSSGIAKLEARRLDMYDIEQLESERDELRSRYVDADKAEGQLVQLDAQRRDLAREITLSTTQIATLADELGDLDAVRAAAKELPEIESKERAAEAEQKRIELTLQLQDTARQDLLAQKCPLLEVACPKAGDTSWVELRFEQRVTKLQGEGIAAGARHAEYATALNTGRTFAARLPDLEQRERDLIRITDAREQQQKVATNLDKVRAETEQLASQREALKVQGNELSENIRAAHELERELAGIPDKIAHRDEISDQLKSSQDESVRLLEQLEPLKELVQQLPELDARIEDKAALKQRYDRATVLQSQMPDLIDKLKANAKILESLGAQVTEAESGLSHFAGLDGQIREAREIQGSNKDAYESYLRSKAESDSYEAWRKTVGTCEEQVFTSKKLLAEAQDNLANATRAYDAEKHDHAKLERDRLISERGALRDRLHTARETLDQRLAEILRLRGRMDQLAAAIKERAQLEQTGRDIEFIREVIRTAGPAITESLVQNVTYNASEIFGDIMDDHTMELRWEEDYEIVVRNRAEDRKFLQLSGGEQMSAALAVRLALIKQVSEIGVAFFDEPTQNMDSLRRSNLAGQIHKIAGTSGFEQLIVISHDDAFEEHTDSVVRLAKEHGRTVVK